jgi:hypothetical protein
VERVKKEREFTDKKDKQCCSVSGHTRQLNEKVTVLITPNLHPLGYKTMRFTIKNTRTGITYLSLPVGGIFIFGLGILLGMMIQWVSDWFSY